MLQKYIISFGEQPGSVSYQLKDLNMNVYNLRIIILVLYLWTTAPVFCQTTLIGKVMEYQGSEKKTNLAGVELFVQGAGSTTSEEDGMFKLVFRNKKKGDPVVVRRIEKLGYEIFNTDAVEQWVIGNTFTIVMCKRELFKALRDNYFRVSSASYEKQYQKEKKKLENLKKKNKSLEREFEQKLVQLKNEYEEQLEVLDRYVERFARIDLSELSNVEKGIIELVQNGQIDEAIEEYEKLDFLNKYKDLSISINKIDSAIKKIEDISRYKIMSRDSLSRELNRQIELYLSEGGENNLSKAGDLLKNIALSDTSNIPNVLKYAEFALKTQRTEDADRFFNIVLNLTDDISLKEIIHLKLQSFALKPEDKE